MSTNNDDQMRTDHEATDAELRVLGLALFFGIPTADVRAELARCGDDESRLPEEWYRRARRRMREAAAATGDYDLAAMLTHYLDKERRNVARGSGRDT